MQATQHGRPFKPSLQAQWAQGMSQSLPGLSAAQVVWPTNDKHTLWPASRAADSFPCWQTSHSTVVWWCGKGTHLALPCPALTTCTRPAAAACDLSPPCLAACCRTIENSSCGSVLMAAMSVIAAPAIFGAHPGRTTAVSVATAW